jgi:hypothetical protein
MRILGFVLRKVANGGWLSAPSLLRYTRRGQ